jgi:hypothetical protein
LDRQAVMKAAIAYARMNRKVTCYEWLIKCVDDIATIRTYIHKRDAFQREADKLQKWLPNIFGRKGIRDGRNI